MVKVERAPVAPLSLATERAKANSRNYRNADVVTQLAHDFHRKCYLCEIGPVQDPEVEHLRAHHNGQDRERMFDWNNLFYSCGHCNSVKNMKQYEESILDCCQTEPELFLSQELIDGHVIVSPIGDSDEAKMTAQLITDCFEKRTSGIRIEACETRIDELQKTMTALYHTLEKYKEDSSRKELRALRGMLDRSYKFAGFTRTYVRQHIAEYPDLAESVAL